jgi:8-hydroxy-5-deazaflavin:NADPH oxidoreductase
VKIAVIGAGNVGTALVTRLKPKGHELMLSYSRDPGKLQQAQAHLAWRVERLRKPRAGARCRAGSALGCGAGCTCGGRRIVGQGLWDSTNTLLPDMSGLTIGTTTSGGEEVAKRRRPIRLRKTHDHQVFAAFDR